MQHATHHSSQVEPKSKVPLMRVQGCPLISGASLLDVSTYGRYPLFMQEMPPYVLKMPDTLTLTHSCVVFSSGQDTLKVTSLMHSPHGYIWRTEWFLVFQNKISSSGWLVELFLSFLMRQSDSFGFGLLTLTRKLLHQNLLFLTCLVLKDHMQVRGICLTLSQNCANILIEYQFAHTQCSNNNKRNILS